MVLSVEMSAFTPYKRSGDQRVGDASLPGELIKFPYGLTSILIGFPQCREQISESDRKSASTEKEGANRKKTEGFLMKNLLRRDDEKKKKEKVAKAVDGNFEIHASRVENLVSNLGKSEHGHRCIYCGKIYSRKYGLKIHVRTHTGYKPLKCRYCARPFGDPSNLNKHVRLHAQGPSPYKCQFCEKLLVRRRDLERHVKSRHSNLT